MTHRHLLGVATTLLFGLAMTTVGTAAPMGAGTIEVRGLADFERASYDGGDVVEMDLELGFARSVNESVMLGFTTTVDHESIETDTGSVSASQFGLLGDLILNVGGTEQLRPYIQVSLGFTHADFDDDDDTILRLPRFGAGLRAMVSGYASANILAFYERQSVDDENANILGLRFGFSVFPGGIR